MINFVISPSQQKNNACVMGDTEQAHMHVIGQKVYDLLKQDTRFNPYKIPMLNGDANANLRQVVAMSNDFIKANGDEGYHLALHSDAGGYARGTSGLYLGEKGKAWGKPIIDELCALTPWDDVGIRKRADLYELNNTTASAFLVEVSFHDQKDEAQWIHSNTDAIVQAIVRGIYAGLGLQQTCRKCLAYQLQNAKVAGQLQEIINTLKM
jgi:N-acetylmuramoyl-L-alanine amidase